MLFTMATISFKKGVASRYRVEVVSKAPLWSVVLGCYVCHDVVWSTAPYHGALEDKAILMNVGHARDETDVSGILAAFANSLVLEHVRADPSCEVFLLCEGSMVTIPDIWSLRH